MSPPRTARLNRPVLLGLLLLSVVPVAAGAFRLVQLAHGPDATGENARFLASPAPIALHVPSSSLFALLGALELAWVGPRGRWHRLRGKLLLASGVVAALSGLWMSLFYALPAHDGPLLLALRVLFGSAMLGSLLLGLRAIRQRDARGHRAWMLRGYAIGMGAGTQVLTHVPWLLLFGPPTALERALLMGAGWAVNLAAVECLLQRQRRRAPRSPEALAPPGPASGGRLDAAG